MGGETVVSGANASLLSTPVLVGTNAVETSFFSWLYLNMSLTPPTQPQFDSIIQSQMALYSAEAQEVARANYPFDPANATRNWINVGAPVIDLLVVCAEQFAAEALPTAFRYHWDVAPANYVLESIFHLGATHTCEVPFFFGTGSVFYFKFTAKVSFRGCPGKRGATLTATGRAGGAPGGLHRVHSATVRSLWHRPVAARKCHPRVPAGGRGGRAVQAQSDVRAVEEHPARQKLKKKRGKPGPGVGEGATDGQGQAGRY